HRGRRRDPPGRRRRGGGDDMSATLAPPRAKAGAEPPPVPPERRTVPRWAWALVVVGLWIVVWSFTKGRDTLARPSLEATDVHDNLTSFRDTVLASRDTKPIGQFTYA